jgi:integrase
MALNLYRRHGSHCAGGRPLHARTYESDEARRGWKNCFCPIYASGTVRGSFKRRNTERTTWTDAKTTSAVWEASGWSGEVAAPLAPPVAATVAPEKVTIDRAVRAFLSEHAGISALNTQKKYLLILKKLKEYSEAKGYVLIEQWGPIDVREFRTGWGVSPLTASKNMTVVKSFFEFAVNNEWITRNPARLVKEVRGRSDGSGKERIAFSDDELKRMFEACETKYGRQEVKWSRTVHHKPALGEYVRYNYKWTGQDLADFISVSVYTGLRISDVCTFHISRLRDTGECQVRTTKNGKKVYTWLPTWLQERLRLRAEKHGPFLFGEHTTKDSNVVTDVWRRKLKRLWDLCGPWSEKPTPHRFRHTFARILLQQGNVTVRDVAELMGDSEAMVHKHYAAWVPERQARLTKVLQDAFEDKPRPSIAGGS